MPSSKLENGKQKKVNRTCQISRLHNNSSIAVFIKPTLIWSRPACHLVSVNRTSLIVFIARLEEFQDVSALCGQHYSFIVASDHRGSYKSQRNSIMQMRCNSNSNSESCTFLFVMSHLFRTETLWWSSHLEPRSPSPSASLNNWWTQVNISAWHILGTQQDLPSQQRNHKYNGKRISSMILGNEAGLLTISSLLDMGNKPLQGDWNTQTAARANTNWYFICQ